MDVRGQEVGEIPNNYPSSAVDKGGWYIHKTDLRVWKGFACNFSSIELFSVEADIYCAIFVNMRALTERAWGGGVLPVLGLTSTSATIFTMLLNRLNSIFMRGACRALF